MRRLALALTALTALAPEPGARATQPPSLRLAAAASVRPAVEELLRAFLAESGVQAAGTSFGASGALFAQIRNGARFDVFLSADRDFPRRLVEAGLGGPEVVYAIGRLVVWTPHGSTVPTDRLGLRALASPRVRRIAIANPAVAPYGRAAQAALEAAGVLAAVRPRLVFGESVAQAAQFAATGAVDAAILPASLVRDRPLSAGSAVPVPPALHPRLEQSAVVLTGGREPALARRFLEFVTGPRGREILGRHGYDLP